MSTIVIHQPHFLPWLPYISLISAADYFVVLDNVQYKPRYYINRTKIFTRASSALDWVSIPTTGTQSKETREAVVIRDSFFFKAINKIVHNYRHASYFQYWAGIENEIIDHRNELLVDLNINLLIKFLEIIEIKPPRIIRSSQLPIINANCRTHRYQLICEATNCDTILSGIGKAKDIHDINSLKEKGIDFRAMRPALFKEFNIVEGLSLIDGLLMNGSRHTHDIVIEFSNAIFGANMSST